jgi:hypothetical protein
MQGPVDCFVTTVKHEGVIALYRVCSNMRTHVMSRLITRQGLSSPLVGCMLENAFVFSSYGQIKLMLSRSSRQDFDLGVILATGTASGCLAAVVNTPVELLKCRRETALLNTKCAVCVCV